MEGSGGAGLRPHERLRTRGEYQQVFRRGIRVDGPLFLLVAAPNGRGFCRLGLGLGRKLGTAVKRNRVKRLLRESFRRHKGAVTPAVDLVLLPKPAMLSCALTEVEREYAERLLAFVARRAQRRRRAGPSVSG